MSYKLADGSMSSDYEIGDKFKITQRGGIFSYGEIITFTEDDETECPYFTNDKGVIHFKMWRRLSPVETKTSPLSTQVDGDHYKNLKIQPAEYNHANKIPFIEGCIIKYATRWENKGGIKDLQKIKHFAELLIELEERENGKS